MTHENSDRDWKVEVAGQYDSEVTVYEQRRFSGTGGRFFDVLEKDRMTSALKRCSVLQIGTATGRFAEHLPPRGFDFYGIEISENMARHAAERTHGKTQILRGDGERLPFNKGSFENVLSVRSFHFLPDPDRFVKEAYRVLLPGGRLIASFEVLVYLSTLLQTLRIMPPPFPSRRYHRIDLVARMFRLNGFEIISKGKVTKLPLNVYKKLPSVIMKMIIRFHDFLPSWFGTIGIVVAQKPNNQAEA